MDSRRRSTYVSCVARILPALIVLILVCVATWPATGQGTTPTYRSGVEIVALSVSVVDARRQFVTDLEPRDFEVLENGIRRELAFFGAAAVPVDVMLLLDTSSSMDAQLAIVADAAAGFIRTLRPRDRAAVVGFTTRVTMLQPFTSDVALLEAAVRRPVTSGKTAFYDALYIAANTLLRERRNYLEIRRQALVILSDGRDTASLASSEEATAAVRRTAAMVFAISPERRFEFGQRPWNQTREGAEAMFTLTSLANETGGRAFFLEELQRLAAVYNDIATELRHQYTIGFEPDDSGSARTFRRLLVRVVSRADATVRARRGYTPSR